MLPRAVAGGALAPPETTEEPHLREGEPLALSPELDQLLAQAFPPGSSEKQLLKTLAEQGFKFLPPCKGDNLVRAAAFTQQGGGIIWLPLTANVFWRIDEADNVVWTKGFVSYMGL